MALTANFGENLTAPGGVLEAAPTNFYLGLAVAAGIGALIGLEREHNRDRVVVAGVRTFPLFSVAGYLLTAFSLALGDPWVLAAGVLAMGAMAIALMVLRHQLGNTGLTTPAAVIVTFAIGALVAFGLLQEAVVVGLGVTFLLLTKERLHRFAHVLGDEELLGALQFLALLFILFPLSLDIQSVPGVPFVGRGQLIDPPKLLLLVLFVSGISFVSFLVMRWLGPRRGLEFSGLLGGLVNSEATTTSIATYVDENKGLVRLAASAVLLATTTMFLRNLAIAGFADASLDVMQYLLVPALAMTAVAAFFIVRERRGERVRHAARIQVSNPFALGPALKFAALFAGLSILSTLAARHLGDLGVYAIALGGFVSAGAAVASVAALYAGGTVPLGVAGATAVLATLIGVVNKVVILRAVGDELRRRVQVPVAVISAVGVVALLVAALALRLGWT